MTNDIVITQSFLICVNTNKVESETNDFIGWKLTNDISFPPISALTPPSDLPLPPSKPFNEVGRSHAEVLSSDGHICIFLAIARHTGRIICITNTHCPHIVLVSTR
jgi:hypothetical protein